MLQRMIAGIICAIKTILSDYFEQFNSNITNQLKTAFSIMEYGSMFFRERQVHFCVSSFERKLPLI